MTKTRGQRAEAAAAYYENEFPNPLIAMRYEHDPEATHRTYAQYLGIARGVVAQAEDGMYPLIPAAYRRHITNIRETNQAYQQFRKARREVFWDKSDFPETPAPKNPMGKLLQWFDLSAYVMASRLCVPHGDIHRLTHGARSLTESTTAAFKQIGLDDTWINQFNDSLRRTHAPRVSTTIRNP